MDTNIGLYLHFFFPITISEKKRFELKFSSWKRLNSALRVWGIRLLSYVYIITSIAALPYIIVVQRWPCFLHWLIRLYLIFPQHLFLLILDQFPISTKINHHIPFLRRKLEANVIKNLNQPSCYTPSLYNSNIKHLNK